MNGGFGHTFAGFRTTFTGGGAGLAMFGFMLAAFLRTAATNFSAMLANMFCFLGPSRHESRGKTANVGAIAIEFNATRHHFHMIFMQTF